MTTSDISDYFLLFTFDFIKNTNKYDVRTKNHGGNEGCHEIKK